VTQASATAVFSRRKARGLLNRLLAKARTADQKSRLGVRLAPIESAIAALPALIPG
jgi:hypothetical protein